jgi:heme/copper-type cytochrome/quinol oxidase subunit 2
MIYFYDQGLADPIKTDYWLVNFGLIILFLEFITLFVVVIFLRIQDPAESKGQLIFWLIIMIIMAFAFSAFQNIVLFGYFLLSVAIRFVLVRKKPSTDQTTGETRWIMITAAAIVLSVMVAVVFSSSLVYSYSSQIDLLRDYIQNHGSFGGKASGMIPENPAFIAVWGIFYFLFQILFTIIAERFKGTAKTIIIIR